MATIERTKFGELAAQVVTPTAAPTKTVVLMHGFGAPGDDLVALARYIDAPARFVFPAAPIALGGMYGPGRAWWQIDMLKIQQAMMSGQFAARMAEVPDGLPAARVAVEGALDEVIARYSVADDQLVLGGFSQGAMLSLDVALHRARKPAALVLMSGTLIAEQEWAPKLATLAGVPIVQSHGRHDPILPFSVAEILRDRLTAAGAKVDWHPFAGGHEIPPPVLDAVGRLLR